MSEKNKSVQKTFFNPSDIRAPFGNYHHGVVLSEPRTWLVTSGQLGMDKDDIIPEGIIDQTRLCFNNIQAILGAGGMSFSDVIKITGYVTDRNDFPGYMAVRDEFAGTSKPTSTLLIVSGFTRSEFKVEVEVMAVSGAKQD